MVPLNVIIRREDEISLFAGKNPVLGMLKPAESLAVFLLSFGVSGKPLTCAIFWLCFRWINQKNSQVIR
jgi:hypothetical protein